MIQLSVRLEMYVSFSLDYRLTYKDVSTVFVTAREELTGFATTTTALQQTDSNSLAKC